jgi:hypothetical protein
MSRKVTPRADDQQFLALLLPNCDAQEYQFSQSNSRPSRQTSSSALTQPTNPPPNENLGAFQRAEQFRNRMETNKKKLALFMQLKLSVCKLRSKLFSSPLISKLSISFSRKERIHPSRLA